MTTPIPPSAPRTPLLRIVAGPFARRIAIPALITRMLFTRTPVAAVLSSIADLAVLVLFYQTLLIDCMYGRGERFVGQCLRFCFALLLMLLAIDVVAELFFAIVLVLTAPAAKQLRDVLCNPRAHAALVVQFPGQCWV